jgi:hypothetical protein
MDGLPHKIIKVALPLKQSLLDKSAVATIKLVLHMGKRVLV